MWGWNGSMSREKRGLETPKISLLGDQKEVLFTKTGNQKKGNPEAWPCLLHCVAREGESSERKFFLCPQTHIQTSFLHPLEYH